MTSTKPRQGAKGPDDKGKGTEKGPAKKPRSGAH